MSSSTNPTVALHQSDFRSGIGVVVDAGPAVGYGHALRCIRLAEALSVEAPITFYPASEACERFIREAMPEVEIRHPNSEASFPAVVISDLRESHGVIAAIHRNGSRHISIHDLGLGQCPSDVVIDGSVTTLFPYPQDKDRSFFVGPQYMITRPAVQRGKTADTVLVTVGCGRTAAFAQKAMEEIAALGLRAVATHGCIGRQPLTDKELGVAMSTCLFAISGSGMPLYDLLASGVPTIAVAFDRIQLRTADAFHERGAVLSAGAADRLASSTLSRFCIEMLENRQLVQRISRIGQALIDGKGLSRVVEIVRRELWLSSQMKIFTAC
jgi:spore coat polysaccharide biosynthesis predicted glycosyltransferase SpsG